jgi:tRNA U34 5-methylaminomethyl-2-thiouridine-forming methyltransferase MnmC
MERHIVTTADGSHSLYVPSLNEQFHSRHGAIQESMHVFIRMGLEALPPNHEKIQILEVGLGTGLNALLTALHPNPSHQKISYLALEAYPLVEAEYRALNHGAELPYPEAAKLLIELHEATWEIPVTLTNYMEITKRKGLLEEVTLAEDIDLVYFDAFAPEKQPELWTESIFEKIYCHMTSGGILVTYCAKGAVRRALKNVGFKVEKVTGPPGKREMIRAFKSN